MSAHPVFYVILFIVRVNIATHTADLPPSYIATLALGYVRKVVATVISPPMCAGLYKVATKGACAGARPGMLDPKGRAKYDAWKGASQNKNRAQCQVQYIALVKKLLAR